MTNEEKAKEIAEIYEVYSADEKDVEVACMEMAQWKDKQLIEHLATFAVHLNKRGAFRDDLCMDFEHEAQSFIESQKEKRKKN